MRPDDAQARGGDVVGSPFGADGHLDESGAHAFIDGALGDEDAARVVLHLTACGACAAVVAEARGLAAAAAGIVRRLDDGSGAVAVLAPRPPAGEVAAARHAVRPYTPPRRGSRAGLRAAAAALVAVGIGGSVYAVARRAPEQAETAAARPAAATSLAAAPVAPNAPTAVGASAAGAAAASRSAAAEPTMPRAIVAAPARVARPRPSAADAAPAPTVVAAAPASAPPPLASVDVANAASAFAPPRAGTLSPGGPEGVVAGQVRDAGSRPIAGTIVSVPGTRLAATTDDSGRFVLPGVPAGAATLRARRVGFGVGTTTVAVGPGDTARAAFRLDPSATNLAQVVVTGAAEGSDGPLLERRMRRSAKVAPAAGGCFAVAATDSARATAAPYRSPWRLDADGGVTAGGVARGAWTLGDDQLLRLTWRDVAQRRLTLRRDGAAWVGSGLRLTPSADARCAMP